MASTMCASYAASISRLPAPSPGQKKLKPSAVAAHMQALRHLFGFLTDSGLLLCFVAAAYGVSTRFGPGHCNALSYFFASLMSFAAAVS